MRRLLLFMLVILAACQQAQVDELPTVAVLGTLTPTLTVPTASETSVPASPTAIPPSDTPQATATATLAPTEAVSPSATLTATPVTPSVTPSPTMDSSTAVAIASRAAAVELTPRIITLTPVPPGANAPIQTEPQVMADIVIAERQFQIAVDDAVEANPAIQRADIDFVPTGINVTLTALAGQAYTTGEVQLLIQVNGTFATITIGDIRVNADEPPEAFVQLVNVDFFNMIVEVLNNLLTERVGPDNDLQDLTLTDTAMQIYLLVPE